MRHAVTAQLSRLTVKVNYTDLRLIKRKQKNEKKQILQLVPQQVHKGRTNERPPSQTKEEKKKKTSNKKRWFISVSMSNRVNNKMQRMEIFWTEI